MSIEEKNILAVIPARGGSKGVPRKNLRKICGRTLIEYAAECAKQISWINAVVLSTDDEEIASHGKSLGLDLPEMRPAELATDHAKSIDVWMHAWLASEKYFNKTFAISVLLEPTSPMRTTEDIENAVSLLIDENLNAVATVSKTPGHYTPHKALQLSKDGTIEPFLADGLKYTIRQHIPNYYHRNGICYALKRQTLLEKGTIIEKNCKAVVIERPVVNIDDRHELEYAEFLFLKDQR